jgi:hypothetical protein
MMTATVHLAGAAEAGVQRCSRCGLVMVDGSGAVSMDGSAMCFWGVGSMVATAGHGWWLLRDGTLEDDEIPCGVIQ